MNKKKVTAFLLVGTLTVSLTTVANTAIIAAEANNQEATLEEIVEVQEIEEINEVMTFSLEEAIEYALKNNRAITVEDLNVDKAQLNYNDSIRGVRAIEDHGVPRVPGQPADPEMNITRAMADLGVLRRQLEFTVDVARWNREIKENQIRYDVERAYYDLLHRKKGVEIAEERIALTEEQYRQTEAMYNVGTIAKEQLVSFELALSQAEAFYNGQKLRYDSQAISFNNTLGLDLDQEVKLTDTIIHKDYEVIDLTNSIETALQSNAMVKAAQEGYELAELTLQATKGRFPENTYRYREQQMEVESAAKGLADAQSGVEMGVRLAYLGLLGAEEQIVVYEKAIAHAERALELAELRYELGAGIATEIREATIELMDAKQSLSEEIHAFNMALLDFQYSTGIGTVAVPAGF